MIVFVGFDHADMETVNPVREALTRHGRKSVLVSKSDYGSSSSWSQGLPTFPFRDEILKSSPTMEQEYRELLGRLSHHSVIAAGEILDRLRPAVVVLCPGHWESAAMREAARTRNIRRIFLLPTYYELKEIQPFRIFDADPSEQCICAGSCGRSRFLAAGAIPETILELGSAAFDRYAEVSPSLQPASKDGFLLCALQYTAEDRSLLKASVQAFADLPTRNLRIRFHPATPPESKDELTRFVGDSCRQVTWSSGSSLLEDLAGASRVIAQSSTVLVIAAALGRSALVWNAGYLPGELAPQLANQLQPVRCAREIKTLISSEQDRPAQSTTTVQGIVGMRSGSANRIASFISSVANPEGF